MRPTVHEAGEKAKVVAALAWSGIKLLQIGHQNS
jgi:hypothetical protein